ncbi:MAG: hypothetical protein H7Y36_08325 [Armatimonadetes bacterium]|nr:hypothetical protein [Akkermansiaceae bacterium]
MKRLPTRSSHPLRTALPVAALFILTPSLSSQTLTTPRLSCEITNTAALTTLTARPRNSEAAVTFRIDWLSGNDLPSRFQNLPIKNHSLTSTHLLGKTTLTRTILASQTADAIFIHIRADQPGPVHFTTRFISEDPVEIHDRRQLILSGKKIHAHAWVLPFESDVSDDGKTITLAGEGEALIILNLTADPETAPVSQTLTRLGKIHDPAHTPPGPHVIWQALKP